jgi:hypothetical protein
MVIAEHLIATTRFGARLLAPAWARWLWDRLRTNVPEALSCVLMPDHVHLVAPPGARDRFRRVLAAFTARFGVRFDILPDGLANSADIAFRMVRYGFSNPVRAGLVDDPWAWPWSTLRDLVGAVVSIWTSPPHLAAMLAVPTQRLVAELTTTADRRTPPPRRTEVATASFGALRSAVGSALRLRDDDVVIDALGRRLVVQASEAIEIPRTIRLAELLDCSVRTIRRDAAERHPGPDAVLLCLSDARLLRGPSSLEGRFRSGEPTSRNVRRQEKR